MNKIISLNIYCDEIKRQNIIDSYHENEEWDYIGLLIVPVFKQDELINKLLNRRCGNPAKNKIWNHCEKKCEWYSKNNKEVHYQKSDSAVEYHIAKRWLDFFKIDTTLTYLYIFGINLMNICNEAFGDSKYSEKAGRIYNRFIRTAILKSVKSYFHKYNKIIIKSIYHDITDLKDTEYFPWHSIFKINKEDDKIHIEDNEIIFLNSDHRISKDNRSNLIQYLDLLLGATMNCLHYSSKHKKKCDISFTIIEIIERLLFRPNNKNSRYNYYNRLCIDFFPKNKYKNLEELNKIGKLENNFFKKRDLRIRQRFQPELF